MNKDDQIVAWVFIRISACLIQLSMVLILAQKIQINASSLSSAIDSFSTWKLDPLCCTGFDLDIFLNDSARVRLLTLHLGISDPLEEPLFDRLAVFKWNHQIWFGSDKLLYRNLWKWWIVWRRWAKEGRERCERKMKVFKVERLKKSCLNLMCSSTPVSKGKKGEPGKIEGREQQKRRMNQFDHRFRLL